MKVKSFEERESKKMLHDFYYLHIITEYTKNLISLYVIFTLIIISHIYYILSVI